MIFTLSYKLKTQGVYKIVLQTWGNIFMVQNKKES